MGSKRKKSNQKEVKNKEKEQKRSGEKIYALNKKYFLKTNFTILHSLADCSYAFKCGKDVH